MICLAIITACGMLRVEEVNSAVLFGKETKTIQLNSEEIGAELRKIF